MTNRNLIAACESQDCDDCNYEKECDYFCHIYNALPVVVGNYMRHGVDVIYGLKKVVGKLHKVPVPVKLNEKWLESETMDGIH